MRFILIIICFMMSASSAMADHLPYDHAPIGVMGDHAHAGGEIMLSYRYGMMRMDGMRDGTDDLSVAEVRNDFAVSPTDMTMQMHMIGGMYGVNDTVTAMVMAPYIINDMDHVGPMGNFRTHSEGIGDVKASAIFNMIDRPESRLIGQIGLSLPTGSIDERDDTPAGNDQLLPYGMQLGSGTADPFARITYTRYNGPWSYGGQASTTLRLYDNDEDYRLGNQATFSGWTMYNVTDFVGLSLRLIGNYRGDITGADDRLNPMMVPTADPDNYGFRKISGAIGINLINQNEGKFKNHRLAAEASFPLYQDLNGPQLKDDYRLTLGWQYAF
jgi:hypothetical protein